ncbi:hypothetical protein [Streptacidiphilus sp. PB12-B1b]|uniref:hypothetical protein n=1 Tax=Streptacidiphilus sp. PB12-B1b TaxID=2705012 RepID=UPI0015FBD597
MGERSASPGAPVSGLPSPADSVRQPSALTAITGVGRPPTSVRRVPARTVRIGRATDNDRVVSWKTSRSPATTPNCVPTATAATRSPTIGHSVFCLVGDELQEYIDAGEVSLQVDGLEVRVGPERRALLDAVSFPVAEKTLLAMAGPSGAGTSPLLHARTGLRPSHSTPPSSSTATTSPSGGTTPPPPPPPPSSFTPASPSGAGRLALTRAARTGRPRRVHCVLQRPP